MEEDFPPELVPMSEGGGDGPPELVPAVGAQGGGGGGGGGGAGGEGESAEGGGGGASSVPLTMITGALGAGKTTLVNRILGQENLGLRLAVILNEFGSSAGVERSFLHSAGAGDGAPGKKEELPVEEWVELANGCLCCQVKTDFLVALEQLLRRGRGKIDHILLETTGLADPGPIVQALWADEQLEAGVYLDGVITVIDARHWQLSGHGLKESEFVSQVAHADAILLNKTDLVSLEELTTVRASLGAINSACEVLESERCAVDLLPLLRRNTLGADRSRPPAAAPGASGAHDHHSHQSGVGTVSFDLGECDLERLTEWVEAVVWEQEGHPWKVWRMKGLLAVPGDPRKYMLQAVHDTYEIVAGAPWDASDGERGQRASRVVVIGLDLPHAELEAGVLACAAKAA